MSIVQLDDDDQRDSMNLKVPVLSSGYELRRFPALLIGMLGVSKQYEGKGLGCKMVRYAIGQATELSRDLGCRFVTVDADLNDRAVGMYTKLGFVRVKTRGTRKTVWMFYDLGPA
jgi:ribosomal protein S18 acetylase RimI-like enzyme